MDSTEPITNPLPLIRHEKLKIFAVMTILKTMPLDVLKGNLTLSIAVTYTDSEAIMGARKTIRQLGNNPDDHVVPYMIIGQDAESFIDIPPVQEVQSLVMPDMKLEPGATIPVKEEKKTSVESMVSFVRYVFAKGGTKAQQKGAEGVIKKFEEYVSKTKRKK